MQLDTVFDAISVNLVPGRVHELGTAPPPAAGAQSRSAAADCCQGGSADCTLPLLPPCLFIPLSNPRHHAICAYSRRLQGCALTRCRHRDISATTAPKRLQTSAFEAKEIQKKTNKKKTIGIKLKLRPVFPGEYFCMMTHPSAQNPDDITKLRAVVAQSPVRLDGSSHSGLYPALTRMQLGPRRGCSSQERQRKDKITS